MAVELRPRRPLAVSRLLPLLAALCLAACGGGGGGGGGGDSAPASAAGGQTATTTGSAIPATPNNNAAVTACPTAPAAGAGAASATAALAGRVTFERIPFFPAATSYAAFDATRSGLDYASPQVLPARGVVVEAVAASGGSCEGDVLDTALTDGDGWYALEVDPGRTVCVRVRAQLYRTDGAGANWNVAVVDNTDGNRLYAMADGRFASARSLPRRNLHAASGWSGGAYTAARVAAPFAILDTACKAVNAVLAAQPGAQFGAMQFRWSTRNTESAGAPAEGRIGGAYYSATAQAVYLRGDAQTNTDEFDEMVVAHEFGHFMTHRFSRADSIGGDHSLQDYLDPRVAFDEGWATAFAGLVLQSNVYRDSDEVATSSAPAREYFFYIDDSSVWRRSWYSEASVQSLIYTFGEAAGGDGVGLGFDGIWRVFIDPAYRDGAALQTIFSFASALKAANPAAAAAIAQRLENSEQISGYTVEAFAQGEAHAPDTARDLPVYKELTTAVTQSVCSSNFYGVAPRASTGGDNKLSRIRYLRFTAPQGGNFRVTATPQSTDAATGGEAGLQILEAGRYLACAGGSSNIESFVPGAAQSLTCPLAQGRTYVIAVYQRDFANDVNAANGTVDQCFTVKAEPQ